MLTTSTPTADYEVANKKYVDDTAGGNVVVEANDQTEEDTAFAAGATVVIRLDLIPTYVIQVLLHMDGTNGASLFTDSSVNGFPVTLTKYAYDGYGCA